MNILTKVYYTLKLKYVEKLYVKSNLPKIIFLSEIIPFFFNLTFFLIKYFCIIITVLYDT